MTKIQLLSEDLVVLILSFLHGLEISAISRVDQTVFAEVRIRRSVKELLRVLYVIKDIPVSRKIIEVPQRCLGTPIELYLTEVHFILCAISSPQSKDQSGFWISSTWLASARKHFENEISKSHQKNFKRGNRKSTGSNIRAAFAKQCLQPSQGPRRPILNINNDITCQHGNLSLPNMIKGKRRLLNADAWRLLHKYFPQGREFKNNESTVCVACKEDLERTRAQAEQLKLSTPAKTNTRKLNVPDSLIPLATRSSGVPAHCLPSSVTGSTADSDAMANSQFAVNGNNLFGADLHFMDENEANDWLASVALIQAELEQDSGIIHTAQYMQPLLPGMYNLVPRQWLRTWRKFIRDGNGGDNRGSAPSPPPTSASSLSPLAPPPPITLPPLDCTSLLCHAHEKLVVPPHVEEYLVGLRRTLLGGLGLYPGEVCEVLAAEEWDAIQDELHSLCDFSVRLSLDGENISWNIPVCMQCDRFNYNVFSDC